MKEMKLETKRLLLRELKQDDFDDICKLLQDPIVMYAYEGAFSKKEVQEWLDKQLRRYQNDGFGLWGMIEKGSGELIGQCGLTYQEFNGQQVPEIGYLLRAEYWHKGYATEAAIACKEYAFNILNIKRKDWDSNPGSGYPLTAFRVRIIQFDYQFVTTDTVNT